ncbi:uncharacterized protein Dsimw501_GD28123, partial [Drosophila simulans]
SSNTAAVAATTTVQRGQVARVRVRVLVLCLVVDLQLVLVPDRGAIVLPSWSSTINTIISSSSCSSIITRIITRITTAIIISSNTITMMSSDRIWGIKEISSTWNTRSVRIDREHRAPWIHIYTHT